MKLNAGCGNDIKEGWINLDFNFHEGVDVIHNLNEVPYPFQDNTFDCIVMNMVFEELDKWEEIILELYRISKPNAVWSIIVPYYHCRTAFNPYHKMFFHLDTFSVFSDVNRVHTSRMKPILYKITKRELVPNNLIAQLIPTKSRNYIGMIFGEMYNQIIFEMKIIKNK